MGYKIAALDNAGSLFPFRQIGIDVFEPQAGNALLMQVAELAKQGYVIFFISEDLLAETPLLLTQYDQHPMVSIIPVPGFGQQTIGLDRIDSMVEKALGQNIL